MASSVTPSISSQLATLGAALPRHVRIRFDQEFRPMCLDVAAVLENLIATEVFAAQAEPSGTSWPAIAPLTVKVREGTGSKAGGRLGGKKLPESFKEGRAGNLMKIRTKIGFEFGSRLRAKSHLVGKTFASRFKMPKTVEAAPGGGKSAKFYRARLRARDRKGARIRGFMMAVAGVAAPAPGKQLTHPARPLVYWTPRWERACDKVVKRYVTRAFDRASLDASRDVKNLRSGQSLASIHRTSVAG